MFFRHLAAGQVSKLFEQEEQRQRAAKRARSPSPALGATPAEKLSTAALSPTAAPAATEPNAGETNHEDGEVHGIN